MYPTAADLSIDKALGFVPPSLKQFLGRIFCGHDQNSKIASVGQAIMQAARPRILLAPLQIGLGVQMHHHFQSKCLVDSLHHQGFACSYSEVKKYERSSSVAQGTETQNINAGNILQYSADNVDHNVRSIDGKGTFHGMGIIAMVTPGTTSTRTIPRVNVTSADIAAVGRINIHHFFSKSDSLKSLCYQPITNPNVIEPSADVELLWKSSLLLKAPRPQWSGFMQLIHKGEHPGKSSVIFLPMIDMDPNDLTCIYSTLKFISSHADRYKSYPVVTFDQPLWWKAYNMVESMPELQPAVIRLGGFHTQMSFLGSIGHLMRGSGLQELLEVIYADNTVVHMLSGKAVSRAVRGHLLLYAALNTLITSSVLNVGLPLSSVPAEPCAVLHAEDNAVEEPPLPFADAIGSATEDDLIPDAIGSATEDDLISSLTDLMERVMSGALSAADVEHNEVLATVREKVETWKATLADYRTASLWIQYMDMIDILCRFIKAERLGNWALHLQCMYDMLPYLAASQHNLYAKSVHVYLQNMLKLEVDIPEVYNHFMKGLHVVRRSDRLWAGISTDLAIEQCLMRSLKTTGGLTRGRGLTETQRLIWVLSSPACAEINSGMQTFTGVSFTTSEQHKETTSARIAKDTSDVQALLQYLSQRNPFNTEGSKCLRNIATGVTAHASVNCDTAVHVGQQQLKSMTDKKVIDYTFRKKNQAVTMDTKSSVKIRDEEVSVDPLLLFQRLVAAGTRNDELPETFRYELCSYPPALFESKDMMRPANKATLADSLWSTMIEGSPKPRTDQVQYVLDGGALLHRIPWTKGASWDQILRTYTQYVASRYSKAIVVFDGYSDQPSTKDCEHARRHGGCIGATVHFDETMVSQTKKEEFLANAHNKQRFINMLGNQLQIVGCEVHHASGDADLLVVTTEVACAEQGDTVVIADDTDILILLIHHAGHVEYNIWFQPNPKKESKKADRCWNIATTISDLGPTVCSSILFAHAILGCDTTSRVFGIGKSKAVNKLKNDSFFARQAKVFMNSRTDVKEVGKAGEHALVALYNGDKDDKLDDLRLRTFCTKTSSRTAPIEPRAMPPTSAAAKQHSLRVYHQVQVWLSSGQELPADQWGWHVSDGKMVPVLTDKSPAPQTLLEVIRCNCKSGCYTLRCTCRKNGLDCSMACSECRGICANTAQQSVLDTDSEDEDD